MIRTLKGTTRILQQHVRVVQVRLFSDSITYSGGQASEGQGGFYGSGGSRLKTTTPEHHPEALGR